MRAPCLQPGLDTTPGAVKVSGTLVPTSEVGRLCYPEMGPPPQVTPPQKELTPSATPPQLFPSCRGQDSTHCQSALAWPWRGLDRKNRNCVCWGRQEMAF